MVEKITSKKKADDTERSDQKRTRFFEYLRFGESYTSLILGIIVVIVATALLLSFVHNKNAGNVNSPISQNNQNTVQVSQKAKNLSLRPPTGKIQDSGPTETPSPVSSTPTPTKVKPTLAPTHTPTPKKIAKVKPTAVPTKEQPKKTSPKPTSPVKTDKDNNVWTVQKGESLWIIAEKKYNSGYNWVDIARINKLSNPSDIHVGDKLKLPEVQKKEQTITTDDEQNSKTVRKVTPSEKKDQNTSVKTNPVHGMTKITGDSYSVMHGDNLWDIALRAYGDGFKWVDIARANNLANPRIIHAGNKFKIPRNK